MPASWPFFFCCQRAAWEKRRFCAYPCTTLEGSTEKPQAHVATRSQPTHFHVVGVKTRVPETRVFFQPLEGFCQRISQIPVPRSQFSELLFPTEGRVDNENGSEKCSTFCRNGTAWSNSGTKPNFPPRAKAKIPNRDSKSR